MMNANSINNIVVIRDLRKAEYYRQRQNYTKAIEIYQRTASRGHRKSLYLLGECYQITGNLALAEEYFDKAAVAGIPQGLYQLARYYHLVRGNGNKAVVYYQKALDAGIARAAVDLGSYYRNRDKDRAERYYFQAVAIKPELLNSILIKNFNLNLALKFQDQLNHETKILLVCSIEFARRQELKLLRELMPLGIPAITLVYRETCRIFSSYTPEDS